MSNNLDIKIKPVTRVEGYGAITLNVKEGTIENIKWEVIEAPRFFESIVLGKNFNYIDLITSKDLWYMFYWTLISSFEGS